MKSDTDLQQHTKQMEKIWNKVADDWHKWSDHVSRWTKNSTMQMIEEADIEKGSTVLDVAAGNGKQSFLVAEIVGSEGHVLTTDISNNLLNIAKQIAENKGYNQIETKYMQAEDLEIEDETIDTVICKNGLMLFGDWKMATNEVFRVLKPGGKFAGIVFSTPESNPWLAIAGKKIMEAAQIPPPKPGTPGLFGLCQTNMLDNLLTNAGFVDLSISKVKDPFNVPNEIDFVKFLQEAPGMLVLMITRLPSNIRDQVMDEIRQAYTQFQDDQGYNFPAEFIVFSGRKPLSE